MTEALATTLIRLEKGRAPWEPAEDAPMLREYLRWDFPQCGLVVQAEERFLFDLLGSDLVGVDSWAYVHVTKPETVRLEGVDARDFARVKRELFSGRPHVLATAPDLKLDTWRAAQ